MPIDNRSSWIRVCRQWLGSRDGNFGVMLGLVAPMLAVSIAGGIDFLSATSQKQAMQAAADSAAIAAVREASLKGWRPDLAAAITYSVAEANYETHHAAESYFSVKSDVDVDRRRVTVVIEQDHYPYFFARAFPTPQLRVEATATAAGSTNICVIGLEKTRPDTVLLDNSAQLSASECAVFSNSQSSTGLSASGRSKLAAQLTCTAGGYGGALTNFSSAPLTDCPPADDPLADRPAPSFAAGCKERGLRLRGGASHVTLSPGVYCDGLTIEANAQVQLEPGVYIIKDGPLVLGSNATVTGRDVGFYFTGRDASFLLESGSSVDLEAGRSGAMAGLLFHQDRRSDEADFILRSNKASNLLGTIYLPNGNFIIDTNSKVADAAAYTAIVTRTLTLLRQPHVVLNADYDATDVPVPEGLGGGSAVRLVK